MATAMRVIDSAQLQPCGLLQGCGAFQDHEAAIPFFLRRKVPFYHPVHRSSSPNATGPAASSCGVYEKLRSSNLDYHHDPLRVGRFGRSTQLGYRDVVGVSPDLRRELTLSTTNSHTLRSNVLVCSSSQDSASGSNRSKPTTESVSENGEQGKSKADGLSALDAYFTKLKGRAENSGTLASASTSAAESGSPAMLPVSTQQQTEGNLARNSSSATDASEAQGREVQGLKALDAYFKKLQPKSPEPEPVSKAQVTEEVEQKQQPDTEAVAELSEEELFMKSLMEAKEDYERSRASGKDEGGNPGSDLKFQVTSTNEVDFSSWDLPEEQSTNSNLINCLVAINIAVYLFGLASPHEAFGITDSSLPVVYGAKVNDLMLAGQWWRFITPMFLHASLLHVGLGSWALLSFGPAVESAYGTLGFAMIYALGGLFGDLTSFFHTTEWTVGGTGPIYALVGTWLVYLLKNRTVIGKDIADDMIRKVVILSAINVALNNSLPIDDWTHLGAVLIGVFFGVLASPTMQLNVAVKDVSPEKEDDDAAAYLWFNNVTSPLRLALIFALCLGIFFCLYQISTGGSNDFY